MSLPRHAQLCPARRCSDDLPIACRCASPGDDRILGLAVALAIPSTAARFRRGPRPRRRAGARRRSGDTNSPTGVRAGRRPCRQRTAVPALPPPDPSARSCINVVLATAHPLFLSPMIASATRARR